MEPKVISLIPTQHPYMDVLQHAIEKQRKLLSYLQLRNYLSERILKETSRPIDQNNSLPLIPYTDQESFDRNEMEISIIKTEGEILSVKQSISNKDNHFKKYMVQFEIDVAEMEKNYNEVLEKAKASNKQVLKDLMESVKWEVVDANIESRINLYKRLKDMV